MPLPVLPNNVCTVLRILEGSGHSAYVVGGCVRDALLGTVPGDWDVCTSALPRETMALFAGYTVLPTGLDHGTVTVLMDGTPYEITTYRVDGDYSDHRHPDSVTFVSDLREDLARRDFTVNAMAYHPEKGLVDPFHGADDLRQRVIRAVGDPEERFREDGLRILRALRFAARLGFTVDEATAAAIHVQSALLDGIARERVQKEFNGLLIGENVVPVLRAYSDVLARILPEIEPCFGFDQHNPHHFADVWEHTLFALGATPPDLLIRLVVLLHDTGKPASFSLDEEGVGHFCGHGEKSAAIAEAVLTRLRYEKEFSRRVIALVRWHDAEIPPSRAGVLRWLNRLGEADMQNLMVIKRTDALAHNFADEKLKKLALRKAILNRVLASGDCYRVQDLAVSGEDLLAMGIPEGPPIGELLRALLGRVMDGSTANTRPALLALAASIHKEGRVLPFAPHGDASPSREE